MDRKHLSDDDIKEAFANIAEGLRAKDSEHQLTSAKTMLNLMNDYLHQNIEGFARLQGTELNKVCNLQENLVNSTLPTSNKCQQKVMPRTHKQKKRKASDRHASEPGTIVGA